MIKNPNEKKKYTFSTVSLVILKYSFTLKNKSPNILIVTLGCWIFVQEQNINCWQTILKLCTIKNYPNALSMYLICYNLLESLAKLRYWNSVQVNFITKLYKIYSLNFTDFQFFFIIFNRLVICWNLKANAVLNSIMNKSLNVQANVNCKLIIYQFYILIKFVKKITDLTCNGIAIQRL